MADLLLCERKGAATYITVNRADVGGLLTNEMATQMAGMLTDAAGYSKYVVLQSAGDDFCLGRDRGGRKFAPQSDPLAFRGSSELVFQFYDAFRRTPIPVVGVVRGRALGVGCAVAALCDITLAAETARFALTEMGHNIMPTMAMSGLVGRANFKGLLYLTYTTEEVPAAIALSYGIASRVVPAADLDAQLAQVCAALDKAKPAALRAVKEYGHQAQNMDIQTATHYARNLHAVINPSGEMKG
jgi:enoyl-CoA hydratase